MGGVVEKTGVAFAVPDMGRVLLYCARVLRDGVARPHAAPPLSVLNAGTS